MRSTARLLAGVGAITLLAAAPANGKLGPAERTYFAHAAALTVPQSGRVSAIVVAVPQDIAASGLVAPGGRSLPLVAAGAGTGCGGPTTEYAAGGSLGMDSAGAWTLQVPAGAAQPTCWSMRLTRRADVVESAGVRAELSWRRPLLSTGTNVRLTIIRGGVVAFEESLESLCEECALGGRDQASSLALADFDGDGVPEVVVWLWTGGAHCCTVAEVFHLASVGAQVSSKNFGNPGAAIRTIGGVPLVVGGDDRFSYAFTSFAGSSWPVQLWRWQAGRFLDVTREHLDIVRADAATEWRLYRRAARAHVETRGALAAWAGDQSLLGRGANARRTLLALARAGKLDLHAGDFGGDRGAARKGPRWVAQLFRFLHRLHYV